MVGVEELRALGDGELIEKIDDLREQLFKLRFQKTTGMVESAARLPGVRRGLARALTVQRQRAIAGQTAAANDAAVD